jgi:hypothetical protein
MTPIRAAVLAFALLSAARGGQDASTLLSPESGTGDWKALVDSLAGHGTILAPFSERRFFPFRRDPTQLKGVLRISPDHGLSLQYTDPDAYVLIADSAGLVLKDAGGRVRQMPSGSREAAAVSSLLPIMRFDLAALYPRFVIRAQGSASGWSFVFTPRDPGAADSLGVITVRGAGSVVSSLEFRRSSSQRVEIDVGRTTTGMAFSDGDLRQFFR